MSGRIPSRGSEQFNLRLPDGMRDRLRAAAEDSGRSMNAEIVARLQSSLEPETLIEHQFDLTLDQARKVHEAFEKAVVISTEIGRGARLQIVFDDPNTGPQEANLAARVRAGELELPDLDRDEPEGVK